MEYGCKKYGCFLEIGNGCDLLCDVWEEMFDLMFYFMQFVLEQGVEFFGLEKFINILELEFGLWCGVSVDFFIEDEFFVSLVKLEGVGGLFQVFGVVVDMVFWFGLLIFVICFMCRYEFYMLGYCCLKVLNLGCGCFCE